MTDAASIALSGLVAQKQRLEATASNVANVSTGGSIPAADPSAPASTVYKPLRVTFLPQEGGGVSAKTEEENPGYSIAYDPPSPYANGDGLIAAPNVDLTQEAVTLIETKIAYKANLAVLRTDREMQDEMLDIFT